MFADQIAQRVVRMVQDNAITAASGKVIPVKVDTVCIHGDTPGAVDLARAVKDALQPWLGTDIRAQAAG